MLPQARYHSEYATDFSLIQKYLPQAGDNNNNNLTCKAPVCAKRKTSVALADRTSR